MTKQAPDVGVETSGFSWHVSEESAKHFSWLTLFFHRLGSLLLPLWPHQAHSAEEGYMQRRVLHKAGIVTSKEVMWQTATDSLCRQINSELKTDFNDIFQKSWYWEKELMISVLSWISAFDFPKIKGLEALIIKQRTV